MVVELQVCEVAVAYGDRERVGRTKVRLWMNRIRIEIWTGVLRVN